MVLVVINLRCLYDLVTSSCFSRNRFLFRRRKEQLALFMDEPSDSVSKSKLFDSAEPVS